MKRYISEVRYLKVMMTLLKVYDCFFLFSFILYDSFGVILFTWAMLYTVTWMLKGLVIEDGKLVLCNKTWLYYFRLSCSYSLLLSFPSLVPVVYVHTVLITVIFILKSTSRQAFFCCLCQGVRSDQWSNAILDLSS